jgi:hypothetical protein
MPNGSYRQSFSYLSGSYMLRRDMLDIAGELALRDGRFPAFQQRLRLKTPRSRLDVGVVIYAYHPDYWAMHGRALDGIGSMPGDAAGVALSAMLRFSPRGELSALVKVGHPLREWAGFGFRKHSRSLQLRQDIDACQLLIRYTRRLYPAAGGMGQPERLDIYRVQFNSEPLKGVRLSHRVEVSSHPSETIVSEKSGFAIYHDLQFRSHSSLSLQLRWTSFEVPDYDHRLYEFENDLPGNFRSVLLSDRGYKWFVLLTLAPRPGLRLSIKFHQLRYPGRVSIGSGLDEIVGGNKRELRVQIQFSY